MDEYSDDVIEAGTQRLVNEWRPVFGVMFPPIPDVHDCFRQERDRIAKEANTRRILHEAEQRPALIAAEDPEERAEYSRQLVGELREKIDRGAFQMPSLQETLEAGAAIRNGRGKIPEGADERHEWAKAHAERNGWHRPLNEILADGKARR